MQDATPADPKPIKRRVNCWLLSQGSYSEPPIRLLSGPRKKLAAKRAREIEAAFKGKVGTMRASKMAASGIRKKFVPAKSWFTRAGESANQIKKITKATYHHRAPESTGVKGRQMKEVDVLNGYGFLRPCSGRRRESTLPRWQERLRSCRS